MADPIDTSPQALRALAEGAKRGPWQVEVTRHPYSMGRNDGSALAGEHVERRILTVRDDPQAKAPHPIVTLSIGVGLGDGPPITMVHIQPEDVDYLAAVSPEVVLALLDAIDQAQAAAAPILRWFDQMEALYGSHTDDSRIAGFADAGVTYGDLRRLREAMDAGRTDRAQAAP